MSERNVQIELLQDCGFINLRGNPSDKQFLSAVKSATGCALPLLPNTIADGETQACWLGPDEWLITTKTADTGAMKLALEQALKGQSVAVNDLSGGQVKLRLSGDGVRALLAKGCTLDLDNSVFEAGACAQTGLAKAAVIIISHRLAPSSGPGLDLIVRRSFADYLLQWLQKAGADCGIEFT
jgi:sarcosine oxidase subunit gamma